MSKSFSEIAQQLDPVIYQRFKRALELGKWPDGRIVSKEQRELCMQAVISYEAAHMPEESRTGYMEKNCKSKTVDNPAPADLTEQNLTISPSDSSK